MFPTLPIFDSKVLALVVVLPLSALFFFSFCPFFTLAKKMLLSARFLLHSTGYKRAKNNLTVSCMTRLLRQADSARLHPSFDPWLFCIKNDLRGGLHCLLFLNWPATLLGTPVSVILRTVIQSANQTSKNEGKKYGLLWLLVSDVFTIFICPVLVSTVASDFCSWRTGVDPDVLLWLIHLKVHCVEMLFSPPWL